MPTTADTIRTALQCGNAGCACHKGPNVHCANHQDKQPSLTVHEDADGRVLVNCKAGCDQSDVIDALRKRGLWQDHKPGEPARNGNGEHPVATYEYRDEAGVLVAIKGRFEFADIDPVTKKPRKSFKWKLPDRDRWSLDGTPISALPLWGAELIRMAAPNERVFVVEGEKAALACRANGLLAVTHPGGASTTDFGESFEVLRGRDVVLWPDNDDPGRKFMDKVRTTLRSVARSIVTIFPTVPDKGDAVEYFGSGHTVTELVTHIPPPPKPVLEYLDTQDDEGCGFARYGLGYSAVFPALKVMVTVEQLRRSSGELRGEVLVESEIPSIPHHLYWGSLILSSGSNREKLAKTLETRTKGLGIDWDGLIEVVCRKVALAERTGEPFTTAGDMDTQQQAADWLINGFAPRLEPTTIYGDGGVGKSMLTLAMAIGVKAGIEIVPGFSPVIQGSVLYLDWEASRQRLDTRIKRICAGAGIKPVLIGYRRCTGPLTDQIEEVLRYCQSEGVVLVVLDSVEMAMNGTGGEGGDPNEKVIRLHSALRLLGTTSILIDHISAAGRGQTNGAGKPIGGVYKTNLARMAFELRKGQEPVKQGEMALGLFNQKRNDDGALMKAIGLKVVFGDDWTRYERDGITDASLMAGLTIRERMIAALKRQQPMPNKQLAEVVNASQSSVTYELNTHNGTIFTKWPAGGWGLCSTEQEALSEIPF